jgi:hypothetical protein
MSDHIKVIGRIYIKRTSFKNPVVGQQVLYLSDEFGFIYRRSTMWDVLEVLVGLICLLASLAVFPDLFTHTSRAFFGSLLIVALFAWLMLRTAAAIGAFRPGVRRWQQLSDAQKAILVPRSPPCQYA